jgi:hypothetical protein
MHATMRRQSSLNRDRAFDGIVRRIEDDEKPVTVMDFDEATPDAVADAIHSLVQQPVQSLDVETGTARRAAELIAELL